MPIEQSEIRYFGTLLLSLAASAFLPHVTRRAHPHLTWIYIIIVANCLLAIQYSLACIGHIYLMVLAGYLGIFYLRLGTGRLLFLLFAILVVNAWVLQIASGKAYDSVDRMTPMMVLVARLSTLSADLKQSDNDPSKKLDINVPFFEFWAFALFFPVMMTMPAVRLVEFRHIVTKTEARKRNKQVRKLLVTAIVWALIHLYLMNASFTAINIVRRVRGTFAWMCSGYPRMHLTFIAIRSVYYFVWKWAEACLILCGFESERYAHSLHTRTLPLSKFLYAIV